jgi:hypothetical protein
MKAQGVQKFLGSFEGEEAAARAYDKAVIERGLLDLRNFDDYDLPSASPAPKRVTSRFRGVCWEKASRKWRAQMYKDGVQKFLGNFEDEEAAARAYDEAAMECGQLGRLNFDFHPEPEALPDKVRLGCMYVRMHVCMQVCMFVCMFVCMYCVSHGMVELSNDNPYSDSTASIAGHQDEDGTVVVQSIIPRSMYVCMDICIHLCIYVCTYVRMD